MLIAKPAKVIEINIVETASENVILGLELY